MGSLSFAEVLTIVVVILIIFGPNRLPEFAKRIGELLAQARKATSQLSQELSREWGDAADPIRAAKDDLDGIKHDLKLASTSLAGLGGDMIEEATPQPKPTETTGEFDAVDADEDQNGPTT